MPIEFQASMDKCQNNHNSNDLLGEKGRKASEACVKVAIFGKPKLQRYTRKSALKRLWNCYGGELPNKENGKDLDPVILPERDDKGRRKKFYDIRDVYQSLNDFDKMEFVKIHTDESEMNERVDKHWLQLMNECLNSPDATYSPEVAQRRVRDCYAGNFPGDVLLTLPKEDNPEDDTSPYMYSIFDIHEALVRSDKFLKPPYPDRSPSPDPEDEHTQAGSCTSALIRESINQQKKILEEEYKKAVEERGRKKGDSEYQNAISSSCGQPKYSCDQAERLVRDCYVGSFPRDKDLLPIKGNLRKTRYLISDIVEAVDYYDQKLLVDRYPAKCREKHSNERNTEIDKCREVIQTEHKEGTEEKEIDNGSGFIIQNHFIITCEHVVSDSDVNVYIYNEIIHDSMHKPLPCEVIYSRKTSCIDLAILYCEGLNINDYEIQPLQLSDETLLQGMSIFSFGYPFFHPGKRALLATGCVSGTDEPYDQGKIPPLILLNCPLNNGNSGGPLLRLVKNEVKVVGVVKQKHIKDILESEELEIIEKIEESLQTSSITDLTPDLMDRKLEAGGCAEQVREEGKKPDPCQTPLNLLTLKLYRALKSHSQFVSSKAVSQETLRDFLQEAASSCKEKNKEFKELASISPCTSKLEKCKNCLPN